MRRFKFILLATAFFLIGTLTACAKMTGPEKDAVTRILGRRIGLHGTQLYPKVFIDLGETAGRSCQQVPEKPIPADVAFTLIAKAIEEKTDDPFLAYDLKDIIQIMGIDLNKELEIINLTPEIQDTLLQFVCSFAQGVAQAKQNP